MNTDELPEGWCASTLGEIGTYLNGRAFKTSEWGTTGRPIIRIQDLTGSRSTPNYFSGEVEDRYLVPPGTFLISWAATLDAFIWEGPEGVLNQHIFKVQSKIDEQFHFHLVKFALRSLYDRTHGSGIVHVTKGKFDSLPISVPPLAEQRRIVAAVERILDKVTAARARLDRVPTTLKRFRQAVLAAACSGRLTADWREVTPAQSSATARGEAGPEELPEAWMWVRFGNQLRSIRSGSTTPPKTDPTAFPILRSSSVRPGSIDLSDVKYLSSDESNNPDNYLADGDLLFTRLSGSLEYVANCARVRISATTRIQYPDRLFCAKLLDPAKADYFVYAFASPVVREMLTDGAKSSAGHQRVSIGNITSQLIPLPPLAEQQEIVKRVSALFARADAIEAAVTAARKRVDALTQAVLAKAFRGELVPTEAALARRENRPYEPAADLLARLQSTATAIAKPTRTRKTKTPPTS